MKDFNDRAALTNDDLTQAVQGYLWDKGYGRIDTYNNIKIITNDYGAIQFDAVFDEALNVVLYGENIDSSRLPAVKAMVENQHNTLVDLETAENDDGDLDLDETVMPIPKIDPPTYMN